MYLAYRLEHSCSRSLMAASAAASLAAGSTVASAAVLLEAAMAPQTLPSGE